MITRNSVMGKWPVKKLDDVAEFLDSRRRPITAADRVPGPYPYYGANGQQDSVNDYIFDEPLILLAEDGGLFDQPDRGIAYAIEGKTWVNNHAHVLRPKTGVELRFLLRVLQNYDVTPWITGSTRAKLTKSGASKIQIPLPPLEEQKRIAAILDKADGIRRKRAEAIKLADEFLKSAFLDLFGDPVTNPKGWAVRRLSEFYSDAKSGTKCGPFGGALKKQEYKLSGIPVWNMDNISVDGRLVGSPSLWISEDKFEQLSSYAVKDGDIIISRAGTVGKMCVVRSEYGNSIISTNLIRLRLGHGLFPDFFVALMTHCKGRVGRLKTGPDGAFTHMSTGVLDTFALPYPPPNKQARFVELSNAVEEILKDIREGERQLDALFASLQQRVFYREL
ncbi:MAG: restriction endonuclease subunit S [Lentisphaeria bacterium]|nr:restriction endonuclease subunit S [Lentisphaeria bacterium]